ncbi:variable surface protein, partial [Plasmodium gonderi]
MWVCNDESIHLLFPKCEEVLGHIKIRHAHSLYNDKCNKFGDKYSDIFNSNIKDICCQSLYYLNKVYNERIDDSLDKAGFKYLYYWLYKYKLKLGGKSTDIKKFYEELMNIFKQNNMNISYITDYQSVTEEEIENLKNLYDMHNSFIFIKEKCNPNENVSYCTKILDIMNKYKPQNIMEHDETCTGKELHNCKNNIVEAIIIPIFIILVI